jgi:hypothetical protein
MLAPTPRQWRSQAESHSSCVNCSKAHSLWESRFLLTVLILDEQMIDWRETLRIPEPSWVLK